MIPSALRARDRVRISHGLDMLLSTTLTPANLAALFGAMVVLAATPSLSVLAVSARSASLGFAHGVYTTLGIVAGDLVFILAAVLGLGFLAEHAAGFIVFIRHAGALYLVVLGVLLWRSAPPAATGDGPRPDASWRSSFLLGLGITLGDQKAVLFYLGFLPAFADLDKLTALDVVLLGGAATTALLAAKLAYAWAAARTGRQAGLLSGRWMNRVAGGVLVAVGVSLVLW